MSICRIQKKIIKLKLFIIIITTTTTTLTTTTTTTTTIKKGLASFIS